MLIKMGYRNLWRNWRRTMITAVSIGGGMMFGLLFTGIQDGSYKKMINSTARLSSGHFTLQHPRYNAERDPKFTIADHRPLTAMLQKEKKISGFSYRISGQGMLASSYGSSGVSFDALDPKIEKNITPIVAKITEGGYLSEDHPQGVILGDRLAKKLKVELGDKLVFTTNNRHNQTVQELLRIQGIFHTGSEVFDSFYFQMPFVKGAEVLGYEANEVGQIAIFLDTYRSIPSLRRELQEGLSDLDSNAVVLLSWDEILVDLANYIAMDHAFNYILQILAFMIIAAGILNTVLMSVLERTHEFGVMLSIGIAPRTLFTLIFLETGLIGLLGLLLGSVLGWALNFFFMRFPLDLTRFTGDDVSISGFAFEPVLRTGLYFDHYLTTCAVVFGLVLVVGLYPAWRAARLRPVEALYSL